MISNGMVIWVQTIMPCDWIKMGEIDLVCRRHNIFCICWAPFLKRCTVHGIQFIFLFQSCRLYTFCSASCEGSETDDSALSTNDFFTFTFQTWNYTSLYNLVCKIHTVYFAEVQHHCTNCARIGACVYVHFISIAHLRICVEMTRLSFGPQEEFVARLSLLRLSV